MAAKQKKAWGALLLACIPLLTVLFVMVVKSGGRLPWRVDEAQEKKTHELQELVTARDILNQLNPEIRDIENSPAPHLGQAEAISIDRRIRAAHMRWGLFRFDGEVSRKYHVRSRGAAALGSAQRLLGLVASANGVPIDRPFMPPLEQAVYWRLSQIQKKAEGPPRRLSPESLARVKEEVIREGVKKVLFEQVRDVQEQNASERRRFMRDLELAIQSMQ